MKKKALIATSAIAGVLTFAAIAHAGPSCNKERHGEHRAEFMQKRFDRMAEKLGLSAEQKTQLKALKENTKNEVKPLRTEKRELRKELRQLDPAAADYSAKLADIANRKAEIARQMTVIKGNKHQKIAQILTPEQLAKFKEMQSKHRGWKHKS